MITAYLEGKLSIYLFTIRLQQFNNTGTKKHTDTLSCTDQRKEPVVYLPARAPARSVQEIQKKARQVNTSIAHRRKNMVMVGVIRSRFPITTQATHMKLVNRVAT